MSKRVLRFYEDGSKYIYSDSILSANTLCDYDPLCLSLPIGVLEADIYDPNNAFRLLERSYGSMLFFYPFATSSGQIYYLKAVHQTGNGRFHVQAQDYAGVLDDHWHPGILFAGRNMTVADAVTNAISQPETFLGSGVPAVLQTIRNGFRIVESSILDLKLLDGYIPSGTRREVLQQILFLTNTRVIRQGASATLYSRSNTVSSQRKLSLDALYLGGRVSYSTVTQAVSVKAYTYAENPDTTDDAYEVIFDNTLDDNPSDDVWITIDGLPVTSLRGDGFTQIANYRTFAHVVGRGVLYGKRILEYSRELRSGIASPLPGSEIRLDATCVSSLNAYFVLKRLEAYYMTQRRIVEQSMLHTRDDHYMGDMYQTHAPFGGTATGVMTKQNISVSGIAKADCTFDCDFEYFTQRSYTQSKVLTGTGSWTVPTGVTSIEVTLIGGGSGGGSGTKGQDGRSTRTAQRNGFAHGGKFGSFGAGGRVRTVSLAVTPGQTFSYSCGAGGEGGVWDYDRPDDSIPGSDGGVTTFGTYSSASGQGRLGGIKDVFTNKLYAGSLTESQIYQRLSVTDDTNRAGGTSLTIPIEIETPSALMYSLEEDIPTVLSATGNDPWVEFEPDAEIVPVDEIEIDGYLLQAFHPTTYSYFRYPPKQEFTPALANTPKPAKVVYEETEDYLLPASAGGSSIDGAGGDGALAHFGFYGDLLLGDGGDGRSVTTPGVTPLDINNELYGYGGGPGYPGGAGGDAGCLYYGRNVGKVVVGLAGKGGEGGKGGKGAPGCIIIYY